MLQPKALCEHLGALKEVTAATAHECAECVKTGSAWVHLRTCQSCGVTLCCDASPNQHMTAHFRVVGHPVVASAELGERWLWCYVDEQFAEY